MMFVCVYMCVGTYILVCVSVQFACRRMEIKEEDEEDQFINQLMFGSDTTVSSRPSLSHTQSAALSAETSDHEREQLASAAQRYYEGSPEGGEVESDDADTIHPEQLQDLFEKLEISRMTTSPARDTFDTLFSTMRTTIEKLQGIMCNDMSAVLTLTQPKR